MRILLISSSRLGDAILSTGLLNHLIERHPDARFTVACGPVAASLFEAVPRLERVIVMRKGPFGAHWRTLLANTMTTYWHMVVDMRGSATAWVVPTLRRRVYHRRDRTAHRVEDMRHTLDLAEPAAPCVWLADAHRAYADAALGTDADGKLLAVCPTANWEGKVWPTDRFAELIAGLTGPGGRLEGAKVAVVGGPGEEEVAAPVSASVPADRLIDLVGETVLNTAAVFERAALFVGNDSGLMHLAAAAGAPTLGLFGPTRDENYAPWGPRAAVVRTDRSFEELQADPDFRPSPTGSLMVDLPVSRALEAAEALLDRGD